MTTQTQTETRATHTPGPWEVEYDPSHTRINIIAAALENEPLATIRPQDTQRDGGRDYDLEHANARLIAAAPELLAALKEMTKCVTLTGPHGIICLCTGQERIDAALAAIAKAASPDSR